MKSRQPDDYKPGGDIDKWRNFSPLYQHQSNVTSLQRNRKLGSDEAEASLEERWTESILKSSNEQWTSFLIQHHRV